MATLILFGAGASAYCGERTIMPYNPPLGKDLFIDLEKEISELSKLPQNIKDVFKNDFEKGMELFMKHNFNEAPIDLMKKIGRYFLKFHPEYIYRNYYFLLLDNLIKMNKKVVFASLNYEMILEEVAIKYIGIKKIAYNHKSFLPHLKDCISIIKPHGSANFIPENKNNFVIKKPDFTGTVCMDSSEHIKPFARDDAKKLLSDDINIYQSPAISCYMLGKPTYFSGAYVNKQRKLFKQAVSSAGRIIIIGVKLNEEDKHIWQPIAETKAIVGYVEPCPDDIIKWTKNNRRRKKNFILERDFESCFSEQNFSKNIENFISNKQLPRNCYI